jgi:hypothetical protein
LISSQTRQSRFVQAGRLPQGQYIQLLKAHDGVTGWDSQSDGKVIDDRTVCEQLEHSKTAQENITQDYDSSPGLGSNRPEPYETRTKSVDGAG